MTSAASPELKRARLHWERGEVDAGWDLVAKELEKDPHDVNALFLGGHIYEKAGNIPVSYHLFRRSLEIDPQSASGWLNFGRVAESLWRTEEAEEAYRKAIALSTRDGTTHMALGNMAALCVDNGRFKEAAEWSRKALAIDPDSRVAKANLGFAQLALRDWAHGWANYRHCIGTDFRKRVQYHGEPEWDGTPGKRVVLYGEQGLGDEVSFASMIPDAAKDCEKLILDCDPRLANLFRRSFPHVKVYGTRNAKHLNWAAEDRDFDASLPMGQVGEYYRTSAEAFPGTPYLVADPERVLMWKALWQSKKKPAIGIAWTGGVHKTGAHVRTWSLEQMRPLFDAVDAHWVSLQYKDAAKDIAAFKGSADIRQYPHATLTADYDDTAALVASLDLVICMQTAVAHLGGALGVPTWVGVPSLSQWRYGTDGDSIPWYRSLRVYRQTDSTWRNDFRRMAKDLHAHFGKRKDAAADAA